MYDLSIWEYALAGVDAVLFSALAFQLLQSRIISQHKAGSVSDAFAILGRELRRAVPTIPEGYTWREGIMEAQKLNLNVDWQRVLEATDAYEAYRYGGLEDPRPNYGEVLTLAKELRRVR